MKNDQEWTDVATLNLCNLNHDLPHDFEWCNKKYEIGDKYNNGNDSVMNDENDQNRDHNRDVNTIH